MCFQQRFVLVLTAFRRFWYKYICFDPNYRMVVVASIQMLLARLILDMAYFRHYYYYGHLLSIIGICNPEKNRCYARPASVIINCNTALKRKSLHFDEMFITGCTGSCQNDNFQCSQWWKFRQNDDIFVSVRIEMLALPRQNTTMQLLGLLHRVRRFYDFCLNIGCLAIEKRVKQKFLPWILMPVITKYVRPYFQLLVDKGLI